MKKKLFIFLILVGVAGASALLLLDSGPKKPAESVLDNFSDDVPKNETPPAAQNAVHYGFTAFPYDFTQESIEKVHEIIVPNSTIYGVHYGLGDGNCVPWREAFEDKPFPQWIQDNWRDIKQNIPSTHKLHIAITPTVIGEPNIAETCGSASDRPASSPFSNKRLDNPEVLKAYGNFARRVAEYFRPDYLTLGVEISELALNHPEAWPQYDMLFRNTYAELKKEYPQIQIGSEYILQSLLLPRVSEQVKPTAEAGDYVGISFYPYGSSFGEKYGAPSLPDPPDQWSKPLAWLRAYTKKPIAIVETGYMTKPLDISSLDLHFPGSEDLQKSFTEDLISTAKHDNYLFVIWFISVDYDRLLEKLPKESYTNTVLWTWTGFFDKDLRAKPAWETWKKFAE